ncbi:transmembrane protease serine 13 [Rhinophrynus dorsalis]
MNHGTYYQPYSIQAGPPPPHYIIERPPPSKLSLLSCFSSRWVTVLIFLIMTVVLIGLGLIAAYKLNAFNNLSSSSSIPRESCFSNMTRCNGVAECSRGGDEMGCVRFRWDNSLLQVMSNKKENVWLPVCSSGYSPNFPSYLCQRFGFDGTPVTQLVAVSDNPGNEGLYNSGPSDTIQGAFDSETCSTGQYLSLRCSDCGQKKMNRIIGGIQASMGEWPWQVSLHQRAGSRFVHVCGGTLINAHWVVTASHCFTETSNPANWKVYAGTVSQYDLRSGSTVTTIVRHEDYNADSDDYDIALMKLEQPFSFSAAIQPVCLPMTGQNFNPEEKCFITGFGKTKANSDETSPYLMEAQVSIISTPVCNHLKVYNGAISQRMMCAGYLKGSIDSCQGDSGGPLVCQQNDRWYLAGVTSWGTGCGQPNKPGVYARVTTLLPWVYQKLELERNK